MPGRVTKLEIGDVLDPRDVFAGGWRGFRRDRIAPGASEVFDGREVEHAIFVQAGGGTARIGDRVEDVSPGSSIVVGYRASAELVAGPDGLEFFDTTLTVAVDGGTEAEA